MLSPTDRDALLDRFLSYVRIDTEADPQSTTAPSTAKQLDLSRRLAADCVAMGLEDVSCSKAGIVIATLPASAGVTEAPAIVWCSHVDTSPENSGAGVAPQIVMDYDGGPIPLPGDASQVIDPAEHPDLATVHGHTLITSDGTTLLGADDKAGIAVIMTAVDLLKRNNRPHGPIRVVFTTDEEIGRGVDHLDVAALGAACGYTLDGDGAGKLNAATFSADGATVVVHGVNIHPSIGKGRLVNAVKLLARFIDRVPADLLAPETSGGDDGFVHPHTIRGGVERAECDFILRSFETAELSHQAERLRSLAEQIEREEPRCRVEVHVTKQYRNMADGLASEPRAVALADAAIAAAGLQPQHEPIRGGTDGSLMTAQGLPTPNLSTGQHTPHSKQEWASLNEMESAVAVLLELAELWSRERR